MISLPEHFEHARKPQTWTCQQQYNLSVPGDRPDLMKLLDEMNTSGFIAEFARSKPTLQSNRRGGTSHLLFVGLECPGMLGGGTCLRRALQDRFGITGDFLHCLKPQEVR